MEMNNYSIILDLTTTHKTMSFDDFCKLIQKKELLTKTKLLLKEFKLTVKPQILLTVYLLNNFNTILLHPENDKNLLILCKTIIKNITFFYFKTILKFEIIIIKNNYFIQYSIYFMEKQRCSKSNNLLL